MTHVAGQADQRCHAAKADRDLEQLGLLDNYTTGFNAAAQAVVT